MPALLLRVFATLLLGFWVALAGAQELVGIPPLKSRVTDLTGTLSADERGKLEGRLQAFEQEKGAQIAVLIVPTTKPEVIEQYSIRVVEKWKLGRKGVDDGVLLLVAKDDRKLRIEVGYGLEGALNDATAKRIVADVISPRFKEGKFYAGIDAGVAVMMSVIGGEQLPPPEQTPRRSSSSGSNDIGGWVIAGFFLVFGVGGFLRAVFGRFIGAGIISVIVGAIAFFVLSSLLIAGIAAFVAFIFSLLAGSGGGWSVGSGGGGWSSGSSGGGFSGGGGSFGGGGASGDW